MKFINPMKIFLWISLIIVNVQGLQAKLTDKYVARKGENGYVFHIFEQDIKSSDSNKISDKVKYDYTYVQETDSISFLSTLTVPSTFYKPQELYIQTCGQIYSEKSEIIYVKPQKNKLQYRLKITIPFKLWEEMITCIEPYQLSYSFETENGNVDINFKYPGSKWAKIRKDLSEILRIIKISISKQ